MALGSTHQHPSSVLILLATCGRRCHAKQEALHRPTAPPAQQASSLPACTCKQSWCFLYSHKTFMKRFRPQKRAQLR